MQEEHIKRLALHGIGWIAARRVLTEIITALSNIILVRLLFPQDFGAFAIIQILVSLSWFFADLGLSKAIVQRREELQPSLLRTIWWTQFVLAFVLASILWILGPFVISYYAGQLETRAIFWFRLLALSQIMVNLQQVSVSLLERRLAYKRILLGDVFTLASTQISTILFALANLGTVSLVFGNIIGKFVALLVFSVLSPWKFGFSWDWKKLKSIIISFGLPFQISMWFGILNGAIVPVFVGRFPGPGGWSGPQAVGFLTWVGSVVAITTTFSGIINQIVFPLMSRLQESLKEAEKVFIKLLRVITVTTFLGTSLLVPLAPEITRIIYTPDWLPALPSLRLATLQMALIAVASPAMDTLLAFGQARFFRNMHILWAILQWGLTVPLVLFLGFWGLNLAGLLVSATAFIALVRLQKYFKYSLFQIIKIPTFVAALTGISVFSIVQIFPINDLIHLLIFGAFGSVLYLTLIYLFMKHELIQDLQLVRYLTINFWKKS